MSTKAEERKALEKITELLSNIDHEGWVNTAFRGCLEDARRNIDEDAAYSMLDRWLTEQTNADKWSRTAAEQKSRAEKAEAGRVAPADLAELVHHTRRSLAAEEAKAKAAAERIVELCEAPDSPAFRQAVRDCKAAKREANKAAELLQRVEPIVNNLCRG